MNGGLVGYRLSIVSNPNCLSRKPATCKARPASACGCSISMPSSRGKPLSLHFPILLFEFDFSDPPTQQTYHQSGIHRLDVERVAAGISIDISCDQPAE